MAKQKPNLADHLSREELLAFQQALDTRHGQEARIFQLLKTLRPGRVSLPALGMEGKCRCVSTVISNLRKKGCVIEHTHEYNHHEDIQSFYRLLKEPKERADELEAQLL